MSLSTQIAKYRKRAFLLAYGLLALWLLLTLNWYGDATCGQLVFESPRLNGFSELLWFVVPWIIFAIMLTFGRAYLRIFAAALVCAFGVPTWFAIFGITYFADEISTNEDKTMRVVDTRKVDSSTNLYAYDFSYAAFGSHGLIVRKETLLLPGVRWVRTIKMIRDGDVPRDIPLYLKTLGGQNR